MVTYEITQAGYVHIQNWICEIPDTGAKFSETDRSALIAKVEQYIESNNLSGDVPSMVDRQTAQYLANAGNFEWINVVDDSFVRKITQYFSGSKAWIKMKAMIKLGQDPFVDLELATANAETCVRCSWNKFPRKKAAMMQATDDMMQELVKENGHDLPEELNERLGNCFACSCSCRVLAWMNPSVVVDAVSPNELACLRRKQPQCFKLKYVREWEKRTGLKKTAGTGG